MLPALTTAQPLTAALALLAALTSASLLSSPPYPVEVDGVERPGTVYLLTERYEGVGRPACAHLHDGGSAVAAGGPRRCFAAHVASRCWRRGRLAARDVRGGTTTAGV